VPGGIEAQEALGQRDMIAWMLLPSLYNREGQDFEAKDEYAELPTAHRTALLWLPQTARKRLIGQSVAAHIHGYQPVVLSEIGIDLP
jgi:hypothetical protein